MDGACRAPSPCSSTRRPAVAARSRSCPAVEAELQRLGLTYRVAMTESIRHTRELAAGAADAGEVAVPLSGDGLVGAVAAALRGREDAIMGVLPGGRGNDFARSVGIPRDAVAACAILAAGVPTALDVGEVVSDGGASHEPQTFIGIASLGFDSDANRIANEAPAVLGPLVYAYGALRALATFRPGDVRRHRRPRAAHVHRLVGRRVQRELLRWRDARRPRRPPRRRPARRPHVRRRARAARSSRRCCRASSRARTPSWTTSPCLRGAEVQDRAPTGRSRSTPTATRSASCRSTIRAVPGAIKVLLPAA